MVKKKTTSKKANTARSTATVFQDPPATPAASLFGGDHIGPMSCRIQPDPEQHGDREIPGTMSDSQLGSAIRRLCEQDFVMILWTCHGRMYVRGVPPEGDLRSTIR